MFDLKQNVRAQDPAVWQAIDAEARRQEDHIELIASENYASPAVMAAQGSCLTNKYAEGYPGKRYYGGCQYVDDVERLAIARAKQLFCDPLGVDYAVNVQPHSGAQANMAAFFALLEPGDAFMGMSLAEGGHLTHGMKLNMSGRYFRAVPYGLNADEAIDYEAIEALAFEHHPKLIVAGASAYSLHIDFARISEIARKIGAFFMVDMAHYAGLVAAGLFPSPFGHADIITTTTHKTLRGPRGGMIFMRPDLEKRVNSAIFPGIQGGPLMHVIAAKAITLGEALTSDFRSYQAQVVKNAAAMAETLAGRGLRIVSGGTQSHVMLVDLRSLDITGKAAEALLDSANITVNKNAIPNDPQTPFVTSGIRVGTPAVTTRGFCEADCRQTANLIVDLLEAPEDPAVLARVRAATAALVKAHPVYGSSQD